MNQLKDNETVDCLVRSRVPMHDYNFKWILEDYSRMHETSFLSPYFYPEVDCAWWVRLYKCNTYIHLYLHRSGGRGAVQVQCAVTVADCKGKILKICTTTHHFDDSETNKVLLDSFALKADDVKNTRDNVIEVILQLQLYKMNIDQLDSTVQYCLSSEEVFQRDVQKSLSEDIANLYESHRGTDIVLSIEGETLGVHKTILSSRSPVFAKMFQQEMKESTDNIVVIQDVTMTAMKEVIAFIYGKAKRDYSYNTAIEVYYTADKYDLKKLRDICGGILASHLNEETAGQILILADQHRDSMLKEKVMKFIIFHMKSCVKMEWWSNIMSKNSELAAELSTFIAKYK